MTGGPIDDFSVRDIVQLLSAVSANTTGAWMDAGELKEELSLQVETTGTVSTMSVQLQGSLDKTGAVNLGSPLTSPGGIEASGPFRYFRAVLASYTGTGTVTAVLGFGSGL